jgi:hypothetical protein
MDFADYDLADAPVRRIVATQDISLRELHLAKAEVMKHAIRQCAAHVEQHIAGAIITDAEVKQIAMEVLREGLRKALNDRIDEFVEELVENM